MSDTKEPHYISIMY